MIYLVRRPFKSNGKFFGVGKVFTGPNTVKFIKSKVSEGRIIIVTLDNYKELAGFFKLKFNVDIIKDLEKALGINKEVKQEEKAPVVTVKL